MQKRHDEIRRLGGDVLAIVHAPPAVLAAHLRRHPVSFPVVTDPDRTAYRAFGLERTSWGKVLNWGAGLRFLRLIFRGWLPRLPTGTEDVLQLGGDFVLDARGRLAYAYRSAEPTDRPPAEAVVEAARAAAGVGSEKEGPGPGPS